MIQVKRCTIDIACERCEGIIPKGTPCLEVNECEKICVWCGQEVRDNWCAFFESFDADGAAEVIGGLRAGPRGA